jgi:hypothetical protein
MRRLTIAVVVLLCSPAAFARSNDLNLAGFFREIGRNTCTVGTTGCRPDGTLVDPNLLFKQLVTELGIATAPQFTSPSQTLGSLGFEIGFSTSITNINENANYWQWARRNQDEGPDGALALTTLHIRKGLPASFEIGGNISWLARSEMYAVGLEIKWALNEGFYYIPDVALRGSVNVLIGARDLQLVTSGFDLSLSKAFAIGGTSTLTPYAGYNLLIINANSHVLDPTPLDPNDIENNRVFSPITPIVHRAFFGLRLKTYFVTLTGAVEFSFAEDIPFLATYMAKIAFDF